MNNPDPLPRIIADRITGFTRDGDDGPFWKLDAQPTGDGREIITEATRFDFDTLGDRTVRVVLHLSPPMPVDTEPPPCPVSSNGVVDPVIATPDGSTG
jgi:hypothetical protein